MTGVEVELKLEFDPDDLAALLHAPLLRGREGETRHLVATYFDTPDRSVERSGHTLRIRCDGQRRVQTVKASGGAAAGLFARGEWEQPVPSDTPVLGATSPLLEAIGDATAARLGPAFVTDVERTTWRLAVEGSDIELAVDRGAVRAGDRTAPIAEVELELRDGDVRALFGVARQLDGHVPLRLADRSKSGRGYALLDGALSGSAKAEPVLLRREMGAADAFRAIVSACIRHYRLNETLLLQSDDIEALHQARVALRRLRSAFSLFRPMLRGDAEGLLLDAQLRRLAGTLGDARNLDVLVAHIGDDPPPALAQARSRAHAHVRMELQSARARLLMLDLAEWLGNGGWLQAPKHPRRLDEPIAAFAARQLERRKRRLARLGDGLAERGTRRSHRVRIEAKKLRYAAEFFAALWPSREARERHAKWLAELKRVQDRLGELNDLAIGRRILAELGVEAGSGFTDTTKVASLRAGAGAALGKLAKVSGFWTS